MSDDLKKLVHTCEDLIRAGRGAEVKERLAALNGAQLPRPFRLPFANLSRRLNLNALALRFLTPAIHDEATMAESAEYALLLQRSGALDEAEARLKALDPVQHPEVFLFKSFCHFNRWEYAAAIPLLRRYLECGLSGYQVLVGQINLAAALVAAAEYAQAMPVLEVAQENARAGGHRRLMAYVHEIRAQASILTGQTKQAEDDLRKALEILHGEGTVAEISALKWSAVLEAKLQQDTKPLHEFRKTAMQFGDWEAVRHTDLSLLRQEFREELFQFHLFGSPWLAYRESAQRALGRIVHETAFAFGGGGRGPILDLRTGELNGKPALKYGSKLHRAIESLTRDFYRPISAGTLFAHLFPGEYFDIFSSPNRVHQVLFRLRRWLTENSLPLHVEQTSAGYTLSIQGPVTLTVAYEKREPDLNQELLRRLRQAGMSGYFSAKELGAALNLSPAGARGFLAWAVDTGGLLKTGAGPGTLYALGTSQKKTA